MISTISGGTAGSMRNLIEEKEYEEATQGAIQYDSNQIQELIKRDVAKRARGRITETFRESLANTTFAYVENLEI